MRLCRTRLRQLLEGVVVTAITAGCAAKAAKLATVVICGSAIDVAQQLPPTDIGAVVTHGGPVPSRPERQGRLDSRPVSPIHRAPNQQALGRVLGFIR